MESVIISEANAFTTIPQKCVLKTSHVATAERIPMMPLSVFPPITLRRPLQVMGKAFKVHSSCAMTFAPDTMLRAVADRSMQSLIRDDGTQYYQHLKKLQYFAAGKHELSPGTKKWLIKDLGIVLPEDELNSFFERKVPAYKLQSDWDLVLQGMGENGAQPHDFIARKMLAWDERFLEVWRSRDTEAGAQAQANLEQELMPFLDAWRRLNPNLSRQSFLLIESSLQILVDLEYLWVSQANLDATQVSRLGVMLNVKRRPMGHWLNRVLGDANCSNLLELSKAIHAKRGLYLGRPISHDLLKKWSSSKSVLMPSRALDPVLKAVAPAASRERLIASFYVARYMTFLCDVVWATTMGPIDNWETAQAQVRSRYEELYRLRAPFGLAA